MAVIFAACGHTNEEYVPETTELELWFWYGRAEDMLRRMLADFNQRHPDIYIKPQLLAWEDYWPSLQTSLQAGTGPDIFWMNQPNAVSYTASGLLLDLNELDLSQADWSGFEYKLFQPFMQEERLYGLPIFFDTIALFYNRELFDIAGQPHPPHRGWTWEEMREAALALTITTEDNTIIQYGLGISHNLQSSTANFVLQNNGSIFAPDRTSSTLSKPNTQEALLFMHDLIFTDQVSPCATTTAEQNAQGSLFISSMMAMEIQGLWRAELYQEFLGENLGIAHLPKQTKEANTFHNIAYVVSAQTNNKEATQVFLTHATTPEHATFISETFLPAHIDSRPPSIFAEALQNATPLPLPTKNAGPAWDALNQELKTLFSTNNPITLQTLEAIDQRINQIIQ